MLYIRRKELPLGIPVLRSQVSEQSCAGMGLQARFEDARLLSGGNGWHV